MGVNNAVSSGITGNSIHVTKFGGLGLWNYTICSQARI